MPDRRTTLCHRKSSSPVGDQEDIPRGRSDRFMDDITGDVEPGMVKEVWELIGSEASKRGLVLQAEKSGRGGKHVLVSEAEVLREAAQDHNVVLQSPPT